MYLQSSLCSYKQRLYSQLNNKAKSLLSFVTSGLASSLPIFLNGSSQPSLTCVPSSFIPSLYFVSGGGFRQVKRNENKIMSGIYHFKTSSIFSNRIQIKAKKKV